MDGVFPLQQAIAGLPPVVIALGSADADQRHIGLLHRAAESQSLLMLHLAWHHRLRDEPPPETMSLGICPTIPRARLIQVAAVCRKIWRANPTGVPYAFSAPNDCFDARTGEFLLGPTRLGLTCASFVLAVFQAAGLPLVDYATWPIARSGDREWQERIVGLLEQTGATRAHVDAVRSDVGNVRYRPEEVAGAVRVPSHPASFSVVSKMAEQILELLRRGQETPNA